MVRLRYAFFRFRIGLRKWVLGLNRNALQRLQWEQMDVQEGREMVKGVSRRVVVVKSPDPKIFEQAIFIIREDFFERSGVSSFIMRTAMVFIECSTATFTVVSPLYLSGRLRG